MVVFSTMALRFPLVLALLLLDSSQATADGNGNSCTLSIDSTGVCDPDFRIMTGYNICIKASTSINTFDDARSACKRNNGDLVKIIDSILDYDVAPVLEGNRFYWIGLYSPKKGDDMVWIADNSNFSMDNQHDFFIKSQLPSNRDKSKDNCVGKEKSSSDGDGTGPQQNWQWADCSSSKRYICSKLPYDVPSTPSLTINGIASDPIKVLNGSTATVLCKADINTIGHLSLFQWGANEIEKRFLATDELVTYKEEFIRDEKRKYCRRVGSLEMTLDADSKLDGLRFGCSSLSPENGPPMCSVTDQYCTLAGVIELYNEERNITVITNVEDVGMALASVVILVIFLSFFTMMVIVVLAYIFFVAPRNDINSVSQEPEDVIQEPEDAVQEPDDVIQEPEDVNQEPEDVNQKPEDVNQEPEDNDRQVLL